MSAIPPTYGPGRSQGRETMTAPLFGDETPMSAHVLDQLQRDRAVTLEQLAGLWSIAPHSIYPYFVDREMTYSKLRTLFRHAEDDRVRDRILADLLPGSGYVATRAQPHLDRNGDGDVDSRDAVDAMIELMERGVESLKTVQSLPSPSRGKVDLDKIQQAQQQLAEVIGLAVCVRDVLQLDADSEAKRHRLGQRTLGLSPLDGGQR